MNGYNINTQLPLGLQKNFFPQSQGNIYLINSPAELSSIPVGMNVSAGLDLVNMALYLKGLQNGNPVLLGSYRLMPIESITPKEETTTKQEDSTHILEERMIQYENKIAELEKRIEKMTFNSSKKNGGNKNESKPASNDDDAKTR